MRRAPWILGLLVLSAFALPRGTALADELEVLRRLDALAAALERVEGTVNGLAARLDRIDRRLAEVETFLQRLDERLTPGPLVTPRGPRPAGPVPGPAPGPEGTFPAAPAGDGPPTSEPAAETPEEPEVKVTNVLVRNKRLWTAPDSGDEYLILDVEATVRGLRRAGRIKARLHLTDRFDTSKREVDYTTGVLRPGERIIERDLRLRVSRSAPEDLWLRGADLREMRARFDVTEVVYGMDLQDGAR